MAGFGRPSGMSAEAYERWLQDEQRRRSEAKPDAVEDAAKAVADLPPDELGSMWGSAKAGSNPPAGVVVGKEPKPKQKAKAQPKATKPFEMRRIDPDIPQAAMVGTLADIDAATWAKAEQLVLDGVRRALAQKRPFGLILSTTDGVEVTGLLTLKDLWLAYKAAEDAMENLDR